MVCCILVERNNDSATYHFGGHSSDMTGIVKFYSDGRKPVIVKEPDKYKADLYTLSCLLGKYWSKFSKGVFPEKVAYQAW